MIEWKPRTAGGIEAAAGPVVLAIKQIGRQTSTTDGRYVITAWQETRTVNVRTLADAQAIAIGMARDQLVRTIDALAPPAPPQPWRYLPTVRPAHACGFPTDVTWSYHHAPPSNHLNGVIETCRELTQTEQDRYDLRPWETESGDT